MKDYYKILGIDYKSNRTEIVDAFMNFAKDNHPSMNRTTDAKQIFLEKFEAYFVLEYHDFKAKYDEFYNMAFVNFQENLINKSELTEFYKSWENEFKKDGKELCECTYKKFVRKINGNPWHIEFFHAILNMT